MPTHRTAERRPVAAITLAAWSLFAVMASSGYPVAMAQQPEPATPDETALPEPPASPSVAPGLSRLLASYQRTPSRSRLASVPKMFGDSINHLVGATVGIDSSNSPAGFGVPVGTAHASKIGDNNAALPVDRVYFNYNHFHNVLDTTLGVSPFVATNNASISQYTLGLEKTFREGLWSVEVRMPFTETYNASILTPNSLAGGGGNVGNLAVVLKRVIHETDNSVMALGLVVDTPTGEDTFATADNTSFRIDNNVTGILPYIGLLYVPCERHFLNAFAQMDIPLGDNTVRTDNAIAPMPAVLGTFTQPTWMYVDVSGGYWLYRDASAAHVTGLAALLEFHYTTALHHGQELALVNQPITFDPTRGTLYTDAVNMTIALNAQLANDWVVRVGGVVPLSSNHRFFDAEAAVQATRYF